LYPRLQFLGGPTKGAPCRAPGSCSGTKRPCLSPPLLCFPGGAPTASAYVQGPHAHSRPWIGACNEPD
jgi:hypothetical protein